MPLPHKINRYKSLIRDFENWLPFLVFKSGKAKSFKFRMRNGFEIEVSRKMLPPFKESFFDGVYLKHFPEGIIPQEPVIIDIGANVGFFSLAMFSQFPKAKIIAFEPMPFNFNQLQEYQNAYPQLDWEVVNKAVAENEGGLTLYSAVIEGFSTMAGVFSSDFKGKKIEVSTVTLNQVMLNYGLQKIDLLKLDCEGSEYSILYELEDAAFDQIRHMSIESHPGTEKGQTHSDLLQFLKTKGYSTRDKMNSDGTGYIWAWR